MTSTFLTPPSWPIQNTHRPSTFPRGLESCSGWPIFASTPPLPLTTTSLSQSLLTFPISTFEIFQNTFPNEDHKSLTEPSQNLPQTIPKDSLRVQIGKFFYIPRNSQAKKGKIHLPRLVAKIEWRFQFSLKTVLNWRFDDDGEEKFLLTASCQKWGDSAQQRERYGKDSHHAVSAREWARIFRERERESGRTRSL